MDVNAHNNYIRRNFSKHLVSAHLAQPCRLDYSELSHYMKRECIITSNMAPKTANRTAAPAAAPADTITLEVWLEWLRETARNHSAEVDATKKEAEAIAVELDRLRAEKQQKTEAYDTAREDNRRALDALPPPGSANYTRCNDAFEAASRRRFTLGVELERLEQQLNASLARQRENERKQQDQAAYRVEYCRRNNR